MVGLRFCFCQCPYVTNDTKHFPSVCGQNKIGNKHKVRKFTTLSSNLLMNCQEKYYIFSPPEIVLVPFTACFSC